MKILGLEVKPMNPFKTIGYKWVADENVQYPNCILIDENEISINIPLCCVPHNIGGKVITLDREKVDEKLTTKIADVLKDYPNCKSYNPRLLKNDDFDREVKIIVTNFKYELYDIEYKIKGN